MLTPCEGGIVVKLVRSPQKTRRVLCAALERCEATDADLCGRFSRNRPERQISRRGNQGLRTKVVLRVFPIKSKSQTVQYGGAEHVILLDSHGAPGGAVAEQNVVQIVRGAIGRVVKPES